MAFVHGKGSGVWMNEFDFSSDLTQYNFGRTRQLVNVTTFGNDDKVFLAGLAEGQINLQGVWNAAANQTDEEIVALDGSQVLVSASPTAAAAIGDRVHMVTGELSNYQPRSPVNDAARFSVSYMGDEGAYPGVVLHSNTQRSSTSTGYASVDGGAGNAPSSNGATAFLHVTQFDGTDATITIEDSANDSTFGSLQAFTQVTGVGSEVIRPTGDVERYVRVALSGTFTTITFIVSFFRHLT